VSDERHDDIAARLRAEAGAQAPERLRADVMLQVRAEPRPRRIRPRGRRTWRPLGAVAAVACVLAALVVGIGHGLQSSPGGVGGGGSASAVAGATLAPAQRTPDSAGAGAAKRPAGTQAVGSSISPGVFGTEQRHLTTTPAFTLGRWRAANLPPRLRRALESLVLDRGRGAH
jgi:hypothetical protein